MAETVTLLLLSFVKKNCPGMNALHALNFKSDCDLIFKVHCSALNIIVVLFVFQILYLNYTWSTMSQSHF